MNATAIITLIGELLTLSFKLVDIIENADEINAEDKAALKKKILEIKDKVTYWNDDDG